MEQKGDGACLCPQAAGVGSADVLRMRQARAGAPLWRLAPGPQIKICPQIQGQAHAACTAMCNMCCMVHGPRTHAPMGNG
eukprot:scaffold35739_cov112-Isochrysis_galbana.AAC.2